MTLYSIYINKYPELILTSNDLGLTELTGDNI